MLVDTEKMNQRIRTISLLYIFIYKNVLDFSQNFHFQRVENAPMFMYYVLRHKSWNIKLVK